MNKLKKPLTAMVVATSLVTATLSVSAASSKIVFDAKYYADTYQDLKDAFGYDENALYQHYLSFGIEEGRSGSPIFDVTKYKEAYGDLNKAFGDNWEAYLNHFEEFGLKEGRDAGLLFDPIAYAEAYPDIKAAFGDDYTAIINHYLTYGIAEGRTAGVKVVETQISSSSNDSSSGSNVENEPSNDSVSSGDVPNGDTNDEPQGEIGFSEIAPADYYGRNMLKQYDNADTLLAAYDAMVEGVANYAQEIDLSSIGLPASQYYTVFYAYYYDYPQHFWLDGFRFMYDGNTIQLLKPVYWISQSELTDARQKWDNSVAELTAGIDSSFSEYQREKIVYDRLAAKIVYDSSSGHSWSGYAGIVEGNATCEGYTRALQYLLYKVGIQSFTVSGTSRGNSHSWNLVKIDGNYYYSDLTWDDAGDHAAYDYFNISTEKLCQDHVIDATYITVPNCSSSLNAE